MLTLVHGPAPSRQVLTAVGFYGEPGDVVSVFAARLASHGRRTYLLHRRRLVDREWVWLGPPVVLAQGRSVWLESERTPLGWAVRIDG
jgi:hypothetical protein